LGFAAGGRGAGGVEPIPYQDATGHGFVWYLFASADGRLTLSSGVEYQAAIGVQK